MTIGTTLTNRRRDRFSAAFLVNGAADLFAGFRGKLVEKIDDLLDDFLFERRGIGGSGDFRMRKTNVRGNVARIVELAANLALYGCWHLIMTDRKPQGPRCFDAAGVFRVSHDSV
jgi:hypothetical protein